VPKQDGLRRLRFRTPPFAEQKRICDALEVHERRIDSEIALHRKLAPIKQGLMQDLLIVRVGVPETVIGKVGQANGSKK
jgi:hypothetical protein